MNWYVPASSDERPKSKTRAPLVTAVSSIDQYSSMFGHKWRAARNDDADGTKSVSRNCSTHPAATGSLKEAVRAETERVERELIQRALEETGGNVTQAARKLKISRKSLQTKMKELGLREK